MYADQFEVRIARVRHRFATALESKIVHALVLADGMAKDEDDHSRLVSDCYRRLHGICGIGPTVGFAATGEAARAAESTLLQAMDEKRRPTETEIVVDRSTLRPSSHRRASSLPQSGAKPQYLRRASSSSLPSNDFLKIVAAPGRPSISSRSFCLT